jgi:deazaflavin-dependent oxidoreductase (nitroreductase family)
MQEKKTPGSMAYPKKGTFNSVLYKIPLIVWRLGFGPILSHPALGGNKMLVLTSWGRVSKLPRHTMVSYTITNESVYVVSGWGERSDWVKNLLANPEVTVQVGRKTFSAHARRVEKESEVREIALSLFQSGGDSHFAAWLEALEIEYSLDDLMAKRERVYFVGFDPVEEAGPPPLKADLMWVWGLVFGIVVLLWVIL